MAFFYAIANVASRDTNKLNIVTTNFFMASIGFVSLITLSFFLEGNTMFVLKNSKPGEPLLLHDEPIYLEDKIIGRSTSGNYSFNFKKNLTFGYIKDDYSDNELQSKNLFVEVEKQKYPIELIKEPM